MTINVSSKGTVIFLSIKLSDIWKLTPYIMYNIEIHKVLNGPKIKFKKYGIIFSAVQLERIYF